GTVLNRRDVGRAGSPVELTASAGVVQAPVFTPADGAKAQSASRAVKVTRAARQERLGAVDSVASPAPRGRAATKRSNAPMSRTASPWPGRISDGPSSASLRIDARFCSLSSLNVSGGSRIFARIVA